MKHANEAPKTYEYEGITINHTMERNLPEPLSLIAMAEPPARSEEITNFLAVVGHELRSPIAAIQGFAEVLQERIREGQSLDGGRTQRAIDGITRQSEYLTHLLEELLDSARLEHAGLRLQRGWHSLLDTLSTTVEALALTARQHHLRLQIENNDRRDMVRGYFDEARIRQVLYNLIGNAIKYSPAGSEIEIGLKRCSRQSALIWVRDHGRGIPFAELPHIFERFYRAPEHEHTAGGLGLGLYLVRELITLHEGRVWAKSREGIGSTFYVFLPLHLQEA